MSQEKGIRHVEEEAQKRDIVAFVSLLTNERPEIAHVVRLLETALQAAYERGFHAGRELDVKRVEKELH